MSKVVNLESLLRDTTMVFTTFLMFQMFNAFNCRSENKSVFKIGVFANKPLVVAIFLCILGQFALIYVPFMRRIFETDVLSASDILLTTLIGSSVFVFEELLKFFKINQ